MKGSAGSLILGILLVVAICILPVQAADNPVPVVTKISPTYSSAGVSSVTITITGSGFVSGSMVQWNGVDKPTTFVSATKLTVKIPGEDLKYPTTAKVRVYNPGPGGGYSKEYAFTVKAAYWIKSIWPAVVELDPTTLKLKGPNSYWEVNKANADPYGDYIFGLGVTGSASDPQVYFIDAQTKFPSSTTKNSVWKLDMGTGKSTKFQTLPKFAMGVGVPSPTVPNTYYYAEGKNVHIIQGGSVIQSQVFPTNIGGIDVIPDPSNAFLLAITRDAGKQYVYRVPLDPATGKMVPSVVTHLIIKASPTSTLYPYSYTGIAFAQINLGGVDRRVLYVTKDDGTIEPWDRIGIVDFDTGDILMEAFTTDLGIEVDPGTTWQSGTSGYLNYANPSGIDYVDGRLFLSSLHYWNKGDKWPPRPDTKCISGKKYEDLNGDGKYTSGEPGIPGWMIYIERWDPVTKQWIPITFTTTDQNGKYQFCNLPPCTLYRLTEEHKGGYVQTEPNPNGLEQGAIITYLQVCTNQYDRNFGNKKEQTGKIIIVKDGTGCLKPPAGMVGWWTGDGTADDLYDGNDGMLLFGASADGAGKVGKAFSLDGIDDAVKVDEAAGGVNLDGFSKMTLDAWVRPGTLVPEYQTVVSKYDGSQNNGVSYWLGLRKDGKIQFSVYSTYTANPFSSTGWTAITADAGLVPTDTFTHVAGVWDGGQNLVIYVDGVAKVAPVTPNANGVGGASTADNTAPVTIGAVWREGQGSTMPGLLFMGLIDEVEIFNAALTQAEIQSIVSAGSQGKCKALFSYAAGAGPLSDFDLLVGEHRVFNPVPAGVYTVTETLPLPAGWTFKSLSCDDAETQYLDGGRTAKIDLDGGETVTCTYRNEKQKGKIVIKKEGKDCIFPPDGITGWWPGDDSMDDIADGNFGAAPPVPAQGPSYADGIVGRAFSLDGQNDAVLISDTQGGVPLDGYSKLTLDAWVKPDTVDPALQTIVAKYDFAKNDGYSYWLGILQGGAVRFAVYSGNTGTTWYGSYIDTAPGVIAPGQAYHVAGVWDGGDQLTIYVNGVGYTPLPQHGNGGAMGPVLTQNDIPVTIGRVESSPFTSSPDFYFDGLIDEVEIFDHALTEQQVIAIHAKGSGGKCKVGTDDFQFTGSAGLGNFPLKIGQSKTFENLDPGQYTVTESGLPPDWTLDDIVCIDLTTNTVVTDPTATIQLDDAETVVCTFVNREEACSGKICGYKYADLNGDGQKDPGDVGLGGVKIRLYPGAMSPVDSVMIGVVSSETGHHLDGWGPVEPAHSGGSYGGIAFTRVAWTTGDPRPASFTLAVADVTKDHFLLADVLDGIADDSFVVLVNGNPVYSFKGKNSPDAGGQNYFGDPAGSTEVWQNHRIFIAKEILTAGDNTVTFIPTGAAWSGFDTYGQLAVTDVELFQLGDPVTEETTDDTGHYCFGDLDEGYYYVAEAVLPQGRVPSTHSLFKVRLACNEVREPVDFFNTGFLRICSEKFRDVNANGLGDPDEGFGGVGMTLFTRSAGPADSVDIGDTGSETGHSLNGWGPIEPLTSGGAWGGIDDARATWIKGDGRGASFTLDAGPGSDHELVLRVLDGQADDSFMVFVNGDPVYQYTAKNSPKPGDGNYFGDPSGPEELWREHRIYVSGTGTLTISIAAMGDAWSGFDTYGQLGVDRADIYTLTPVSGGTAITGSDGKFCFFLAGIDLSQIPVFYIGETGLPDGSIPTTGSVNDPATQPYLFRNTVQQVSKTFDLFIEKFCPPGDYTTYTQGGWGSPPHGNNPGKLLADNFDVLYTDLLIGIDGPGVNQYAITLSSADAVRTYLGVATGTPAPLDKDYSDPVSDTEAGIFGAQVLALQLNVDFSDEGITEPGLGALVYVNPGDSLNGLTVQQILDQANIALGHGPLPAGYTVSTLNDLVTNLNEAFNDGEPSEWAEDYLEDGDGNCSSPLPEGAVPWVSLTRDGTTLKEPMTPAGDNHWTYTFAGLEPGCYDYRVYYVKDLQETTLFQGTECIPTTLTNTFTWEVCYPEIHLRKTGPDTAEPGDTVTYDYHVTNHGNTPLAVSSLIDNVAGTVSLSLPIDGDLNHDGILDLDEKWHFAKDYVIPSDYQGTTLTNTAIVSGSGCDGPVSDQDDHILDIIHPIEICGTKYNDVNGNGLQNVGDEGVAGVETKAFTLGPETDSVDIGDTGSESGHNLVGWSPNSVTYGGVDDARVVWMPNDERWATFTLNTMSSENLLRLRVLDGWGDDSFDVHVNGNLVYSYVGKNKGIGNSFNDPPGNFDNWHVHSIFVPYSGTLTVKVTATAPPWQYFDPYGQVAVDSASLLPLVPTGESDVTDQEGNYCIEIDDLDPPANPELYVGEVTLAGRVPTSFSVQGPLAVTPLHLTFGDVDFLNEVVQVPDITIELNPPEATNTLPDQDHTFTATVKDHGVPLQGAVVVFTTTLGSLDGNGQTVWKLTDSNGQASVVVSHNAPGSATISAFVDVDGDFAYDSGIDTAAPSPSTKVWIYPPQIHVEKSVVEYAQQDGHVTYRYEVTNPGTVPLEDVIVTDDKCSPVTGPAAGGDTSPANGKLDKGETWIYSCTYTPAWDPALCLLENTVTAWEDQVVSDEDTDVIYPVTITKDVVDGDVGTQFTVKLSRYDTDSAQYVEIGTYPISEAVPLKLWLIAGTYKFDEINLPAGFTAPLPIEIVLPDPVCPVTRQFINFYQPPAQYGCTHGYWKEHEANWPSPYLPGDLVSSVFSNADPYQSYTLDGAMELQGGPGIDGAKESLLVQAVAGLLNEQQFGNAYPPYDTVDELRAAVSAALGSGDRDTILALKDILDAANNLGCPCNNDGCP